MGDMRNACKIVSVGNPEWKRPLGSSRCRLEYILNWVLKTQDVTSWTEYIWYRIETSGTLF
jgi:hypothetical protein